MRRLHVAAVVTLMIASLPAHAVSYMKLGDIKGESAFKAHRLDGTSLTRLIDDTACGSILGGNDCVGDPGGFPLVYGDLVDDTLLYLHPATGAAVVISFTAATAGEYWIRYRAELGSSDGNGVGIQEGMLDLSGGADLHSVGLLLPAVQKVRQAARRVSLDAGQTWLLGIDANENQNFDTTSLTLNVAAVPEPASWAMLIAGFGLVGATLRRRRAAIFAN